MRIVAFLKRFFLSEEQTTESQMKKYLIAGLGNVGSKYDNTRHNIGFEVLDALALDREAIFETSRLGDIAKFRYKGRVFVLLKPSTYMNLSGKAVRYWQTKEKIPAANLLVVCDDISLPIGAIRLKPKGGAGGHNGLQNIQDLLGTSIYSRLRFGIGNDFSRGRQSDYVLGEWKDTEREILPSRIDKMGKAILSFGTVGLNNTMNVYNGNPSADLQQIDAKKSQEKEDKPDKPD